MTSRFSLLTVAASAVSLALAGAAQADGPCGTGGTYSTSGTIATCTYASSSTGSFVVPAGASSVQVGAVGGRGGDDPGKRGPFGIMFPNRTGGAGASVSAALPVSPGQTLYVYTGGNGQTADAGGAPAAGGANGGGGTRAAVGAGGAAGGGGGASDVRSIPAPASGSQTASLGSRMLVAAGGGGASDASNAGRPGNGNGGDAGQPGPSSFQGTAAQPGTANADGTGTGGAGGGGGTSPGQSGSQGVGGNGGSDGFFQGGGGGGGLYGGGGGSSLFGQPGAGGSSFAEAAARATNVQIDRTDSPRVTITYKLPAPAATTQPATKLTTNSAAINGTVNPIGQATSYHFQYGTTTHYGSASTTQSAGSDTTTKAVSAHLTGLKPNTTYHYRIVAQSPGGTTLGADRTFTTAKTPIRPLRLLIRAGGTPRAGIRICYALTLTSTGHAVARGTVRLAGRTTHTNRTGHARICTTLTAGYHTIRATKTGYHTLNGRLLVRPAPTPPRFTG